MNGINAHCFIFINIYYNHLKSIKMENVLFWEHPVRYVWRLKLVYYYKRLDKIGELYEGYIK